MLDILSLIKQLPWSYAASRCHPIRSLLIGLIERPLVAKVTYCTFNSEWLMYIVDVHIISTSWKCCAVQHLENNSFHGGSPIVREAHFSLVSVLQVMGVSPPLFPPKPAWPAAAVWTSSTTCPRLSTHTQPGRLPSPSWVPTQPWWIWTPWWPNQLSPRQSSTPSWLRQVGEEETMSHCWF